MCIGLPSTTYNFTVTQRHSYFCVEMPYVENPPSFNGSSITKARSVRRRSLARTYRIDAFASG